MLARTLTHALVGLDARRVEVEAHVELGVPGFTIVGLADRACQEAKQRVRSGIASAELEWPVRRITVNLAPAGLRKEGSGFDLPIALAVLGASRQVPWERSPSTPRSASSRWTGACGRSAACSPRRRAPGGPESRGCSAPPSRRPRRRWPTSSRCPCATSRRLRPICGVSGSRHRTNQTRAT